MGSDFPIQWVKCHLLDVPKSAIVALLIRLEN